MPNSWRASNTPIASANTATLPQRLPLLPLLQQLRQSLLKPSQALLYHLHSWSFHQVWHLAFHNDHLLHHGHQFQLEGGEQFRTIKLPCENIIIQVTRAVMKVLNDCGSQAGTFTPGSWAVFDLCQTNFNTLVLRKKAWGKNIFTVV